MSVREDRILTETAAEAAAAKKADLPAWRKAFARRRTKLRFGKRTLLFLALLFVALMWYVLSFLNGDDLARRVNDWTDSVVAPAFTWLMTAIGAGLGRDWSDKGEVFARLSTLGPLSYIFMATVLALVASSLVAWVYGHYKTKNALDDGTPNFLSEEKAKKA